MKTMCPHCKQGINAPEKYLGKRVKCPGCGQPFTVKAKTFPEAAAPPSVAQQETSSNKKIPLNTSLVSILKATPAFTATLPLIFAGWLISSEFSFASLIMVGALLGLVSIGHTWNIYSHRGCWIQFDDEGLTFCKQGTEHRFLLSDLKSVRCPTASQKHFLDFVHLRFKSRGPLVGFSKQNKGFEEARAGFVNLLDRHPSIQYRQIGDLDSSSARLPIDRVDSDPSRRNQREPTQPTSPIFLKIYAGFQVVAAASLLSAPVFLLTLGNAENRSLLLVAAVSALGIIPAALLVASAFCLWFGKKFGWWFTSFLFTKGIVGAAAGVLSGQANLGGTSAVVSGAMLASMFRPDVIRYFRLGTDEEPGVVNYPKTFATLAVLAINAWAGTTFLLPRMAMLMKPTAVAKEEVVMSEEEQALVPVAEKQVSGLAREEQVSRVEIRGGDRAHVVCVSGLEFDLRKRADAWEIIPMSINDDELRRSLLSPQVKREAEVRKRKIIVEMFDNGEQVDVAELARLTNDENSDTAQHAFVAVFNHRDRLLRDLRATKETDTQAQRSVLMALGKAPGLVVDSLRLDQRVDDYSTARLYSAETGHDYQRLGRRMSWSEARDECERLGGHLATIHSDAENEFVHAWFATSHLCWLGGTNENSNGRWRWTTGEPWDYEHWHPDEPNNYQGRGEHFLGFGSSVRPKNFNLRHGPLWNDRTGLGYVANLRIPMVYPICEWDEHDPSKALKSQDIQLASMDHSAVAKEILLLLEESEYEAARVRLDAAEEIILGSRKLQALRLVAYERLLSEKQYVDALAHLTEFVYQQLARSIETSDPSDIVMLGLAVKVLVTDTQRTIGPDAVSAVLSNLETEATKSSHPEVLSVLRPADKERDSKAESDDDKSFSIIE